MISRASTRRIYTRLVPELEPMTLRVRQAGNQSAFDEWQIGKAKRRPMDQGDRAVAAADHERRGCRVQVWQDQLDQAENVSTGAVGAPDPSHGDIVVDAAGLRWVVHHVRLNLFDHVWNLDCYQAVGA